MRHQELQQRLPVYLLRAPQTAVPMGGRDLEPHFFCKNIFNVYLHHLQAFRLVPSAPSGNDAGWVWFVWFEQFATSLSWSVVWKLFLLLPALWNGIETQLGCLGWATCELVRIYQDVFIKLSGSRQVANFPETGIIYFALGYDWRHLSTAHTFRDNTFFIALFSFVFGLLDSKHCGIHML